MDPQLQVALVIIGLLAFLIWGKWRYDGVTLTALALMVLLGLIPAKEAFLGFGHPAVITVALVLLISKGLEKSGFIGMRRFVKAEDHRRNPVPGSSNVCGWFSVLFYE